MRSHVILYMGFPFPVRRAKQIVYENKEVVAVTDTLPAETRPNSPTRVVSSPPSSSPSIRVNDRQINGWLNFQDVVKR